MEYCLAFDVAKGKSMAVLVSKQGEVLLGPEEYSHCNENLRRLATCIEKLVDDYVIILESTSVYHCILERFFKDLNKEVIVVNPLLASMNKKSLRKTKTDKIDCLYLASCYFENKYNKQSIKQNSDELITQARLLDSISFDITRIKNVYLQKLELCFPSIMEGFKGKSVYSTGLLRFLQKYPHPDLIGKAQIKTIIKQINHGKLQGSGCYNKMVNTILESRYKILPAVSSNSLETNCLRYYAKKILDLEEEHTYQSELLIANAKKYWMFNIYKSFNGVGDILASYFTAELGDVTRFENDKKLTAFCGLDPTIIQSGKTINYNGPISKRGNKYIRKHLYQAIMMILRSDGLKKIDSDITSYYKKKRSEGKHHYECVIACSSKLLRKIFYRSKDYKKTL